MVAEHSGKTTSGTRSRTLLLGAVRGGRGRRGGSANFPNPLPQVVGRPCDHQRQVPAVRTPVVTQRQVPIVHSFILPVQLFDKVLDMAVVVLRLVPGFVGAEFCGAPAVAVHRRSSTSSSFRRG